MDRYDYLVLCTALWAFLFLLELNHRWPDGRDPWKNHVAKVIPNGVNPPWERYRKFRKRRWHIIRGRGLRKTMS